MTRSSPVRNASGGAVIGSTASDRRAVAGASSAAEHLQPAVPPVDPQRDAAAGVGVPQLDRAAPVAVARRSVNASSSTVPRIGRAPGSRTPCPRPARGRSASFRSSTSSRVAAGSVSSSRRSGRARPREVRVRAQRVRRRRRRHVGRGLGDGQPGRGQVVEHVQVQRPRVAGLRHQPVAQRHRCGVCSSTRPRRPPDQAVGGVAPRRARSAPAAGPGRRRSTRRRGSGSATASAAGRGHRRASRPRAKPSTRSRPACSSEPQRCAALGHHGAVAAAAISNCSPVGGSILTPLGRRGLGADAVHPHVGALAGAFTVEYAASSTAPLLPRAPQRLAVALEPARQPQRRAGLDPHQHVTRSARAAAPGADALEDQQVAAGDHACSRRTRRRASRSGGSAPGRPSAAVDHESSSWRRPRGEPVQPS